MLGIKTPEELFEELEPRAEVEDHRVPGLMPWKQALDAAYAADAEDPETLFEELEPREKLVCVLRAEVRALHQALAEALAENARQDAEILELRQQLAQHTEFRACPDQS